MHPPTAKPRAAKHRLRKFLPLAILPLLAVGAACVPARQQAAQSSGGGGTVWDRLAQCESGGNWAINTGNGYSGGLQFLPSTWRAYGGQGQAHHASREAQIAVAERIRDDVGYGAWPACSRKLGLR